jgi:DNA polymerase III sliding clamp (beta) subunit (PCNA family)
LPFTAKDDARPVLACVNFEAKEGKLTLVSADGFRLAVVTLDYDDEEGQALINRDDLKGVTNALRRAKRARIGFEPNGSLDGKNLILDTELIRYKFSGVNGSYPEWQKLIPTDFKVTAHLDAIEALKALQSLKAIADNPKAYPIDITIGDGKMTMANPDDKAQAEIKADADGEMYVRVDGGYLAQVLKAFGGMVDFRLSSPTSPMLFSADGYQVVVMPMVSEKAKEYEAREKAEQATTEGEQGEATVTTAEAEQAEGTAEAEGVTDEVAEEAEEAEPEREPVGAGSGGRRSRKTAR